MIRTRPLMWTVEYMFRTYEVGPRWQRRKLNEQISKRLHMPDLDTCMMTWKTRCEQQKEMRSNQNLMRPPQIRYRRCFVSKTWTCWWNRFERSHLAVCNEATIKLDRHIGEMMSNTVFRNVRFRGPQKWVSKWTLFFAANCGHPQILFWTFPHLSF